VRGITVPTISMNRRVVAPRGEVSGLTVHKPQKIVQLAMMVRFVH
jgi:hypothetical protein